MTTQHCPCQSQQPFSACCGPILAGDRPAETAESLMRSRYTAYQTRNTDYLLQTWHPTTRPTHIAPDTIPDWFSLSIQNSVQGGPDDSEGTVEFIAVARSQEQIITLHEISRFRKENGRWLYVSGEIQAPGKPRKSVGRNDPCPCGSGKKFKKCCKQ